jgi:hypothetical protein
MVMRRFQRGANPSQSCAISRGIPASNRADSLGWVYSKEQLPPKAGTKADHILASPVFYVAANRDLGGGAGCFRFRHAGGSAKLPAKPKSNSLPHPAITTRSIVRNKLLTPGKAAVNNGKSK